MTSPLHLFRPWMRRTGCVLGSVAAGLVAALAQEALLPFQGRLTDANGAAIADGAIVVQFRMYDAPIAGNAVWSGEVHRLSLNDGFFTTTLGRQESLGPVDFSKAVYLEIIPDANGDNTITLADPPLLPRQSVVPAVHASRATVASNAEKLDGADWSSILYQSSNPLTGKLDGGKIAEGTLSRAQLSTNLGVWFRSGDTLFHTNGSVNIGALAIGHSGSGYDELAYNIRFSPVNDTYNYLGRDYAASIRLGTSGEGRGGMEFRTAPRGTPGAQATLTTRMVLSEDGRLGIGTTTNVPAAMLHVEGSAYIRSQGDGAKVLVLGIERSWEFRQRGVGSATALELGTVNQENLKPFIVKGSAVIGDGAYFQSTKQLEGERIIPGLYGADNSIIAWGNARASEGTLYSSLGVASFQRLERGRYRIVLNDGASAQRSLVPVVTVRGGSPAYATVDLIPGSAKEFIVHEWTPTGGRADNDFTFIVTGR